MNVFIKSLPSLWGEDVIRLITAAKEEGHQNEAKWSRWQDPGAGSQEDLGSNLDHVVWSQLLDILDLPYPHLGIWEIIVCYSFYEDLVRLDTEKHHTAG